MAVQVVLLGYAGPICIAKIVLETVANPHRAHKKIDELEINCPNDIIDLKRSIGQAIGFHHLNFFYAREIV